MNTLILVTYLALSAPILSEWDTSVVYMSSVRGWRPACEAEATKLYWLTGRSVPADIDPARRALVTRK